MPDYRVGAGSGGGPLIGQLAGPIFQPGSNPHVYKEYRKLLNHSGLAPYVDLGVEWIERKGASQARDWVVIGGLSRLVGYQLLTPGLHKYATKTRAFIIGNVIDEFVDMRRLGVNEEDRLYHETRANMALNERMRLATIAAHQLLADIRAAGLVLPMLPMWLADP